MASLIGPGYLTKLRIDGNHCTECESVHEEGESVICINCKHMFSYGSGDCVCSLSNYNYFTRYSFCIKCVKYKLCSRGYHDTDSTCQESHTYHVVMAKRCDLCSKVDYVGATCDHCDKKLCLACNGYNMVSGVIALCGHKGNCGLSSCIRKCNRCKKYHCIKCICRC